MTTLVNSAIADNIKRKKKVFALIRDVTTFVTRCITLLRYTFIITTPLLLFLPYTLSTMNCITEKILDLLYIRV